MAVNLEQFIKCLEDIELMSRADVQTVIDAVPAPVRPQDAEQLARELVRQKKLSEYQAKQIYAGVGRGLVLGNYVVLDLLGQGGVGMVLKAEHRRMERIVAIKMLSPNVTKTPEAMQRFQREVKAAARLMHPHIVTALDADESRGVHFLVMEYVEGIDLSALIKADGPVSPETAIPWVIQAARGLQYAHDNGVVHRDIKPSNMLLDKQGTIKILDMGLARIDSAGADQDQLTGTGQIMGTVDYMAPEQAIDTKSADARADIYSLGISLWYLLTGRPVYAGETPVEKLMAHQTKPIPSLCDACSEVSPELEAIFTKMVAKKPDERYQSMSEAMVALEQCTSGGAASPSTTERPTRPSKGTDDIRPTEFFSGTDPSSAPAVVEQARPRTKPPKVDPAATPVDRTVTLSSGQSDTDLESLSAAATDTDSAVPQMMPDPMFPPSREKSVREGSSPSIDLPVGPAPPPPATRASAAPAPVRPSVAKTSPPAATPPPPAPEPEQRTDDDASPESPPGTESFLDKHFTAICAVGGLVFVVLMAILVTTLVGLLQSPEPQSPVAQPVEVKTPTGVFRLDIRDEKITVSVKDNERVVGKSESPADLELPLGEQVLIVQRRNVKFEVDKLIVHENQTAKLKFELVGREIVVRRGDSVIARQELPEPAPANGQFAADMAKEHQQAWAEYLETPVGRTVKLPEGQQFSLVLIPPGKFAMGSPESEGQREDAEQQHQVRISKGFYLATTEVTQGQWKVMMRTTPWKDKRGAQDGPNYAASYISWEDATKFCKTLSSRGGRKYRLPTEAEWEYACRAGTTTLYGHGNDAAELMDYAWFDKNAQAAGERYAHQVGQKLANAWGVFDMHGNVYEWCSDWHTEDYYGKSPSVDPKGPTSGTARAARGGSWFYLSGDCRSASRSGNVPTTRGTHFGFRIVCELKSAPRPPAGTGAP
jgi:serine/threonine protein kinase/formylglycine-generating enzyme required for sulfatase activity